MVLRNGEILSGEVRQEGDRYLLFGDHSELRLSVRDVDFVCQSLDEAYAIKRKQALTAGVEERLDLADWCLRQGLLGYAANEISAAMEADPRNRRLPQLDRRLQIARDQATHGAPPIAPTKQTIPATPEELERLVRCLPAGSVENFTTTIQPMLMNYCATAGCHGPTSVSKYMLMRPAMSGNPLVRLSQRNLYNTLQFVDHEKPSESKLLSQARDPHGVVSSTGAAALDPMKYQQLVQWVSQVTQNGKNSTATDSAGFAGLQSSKGSRVLASPFSPPGGVGSAVTPPQPINPRMVWNPPPQIVPSNRANAGGTSRPHRSQPPAGNSAAGPSGTPPGPTMPPAADPANRTLPAIAPTPTLPPRPSDDEIPNANEVLH